MPNRWSRACALALVAMGLTAHAAPKSDPKPVALRRRTVEPTVPAAVEPVHVAARVPVTMVFSHDVKADSVVLADPHEDFFDPEVSGRVVRIVARRAPRTAPSATLNVPLVDGTVIPLVLVAAIDEADVQLEWKTAEAVNAHVACEARVAAATAEAEALRTTLDDQLPLAIARRFAGIDEGGAEPALEARRVRYTDKASRVHVEIRRVYRAFEHTYLTLRVENRDPERAFAPRAARIEAVDGAVATGLRVVALAPSFDSLAPTEAGTLVIAFDGAFAPSIARLNIELNDGSGTWTVALEGVEL